MEKEVKIKTKLVYFFGNDLTEIAQLATQAMNEHWGKEAAQKGSLADLLIWILKNREHVPIKTGNFLQVKHNKTMLLYFSEEEHKVFTKYFEMFVFKQVAKAHKKEAQTQAIKQLLLEYLG